MFSRNILLCCKKKYIMYNTLKYQRYMNILMCRNTSSIINIGRYFRRRGGGFTVVTTHTIDLFRSTTNCTNVRTKGATRNEKESARMRLHATSFFRRACRHLKLVRPSPFYFSRCARTTPSCDAANCHDVTFLDPPLTSVRVRA